MLIEVDEHNHGIYPWGRVVSVCTGDFLITPKFSNGMLKMQIWEELIGED